MNVPNHSLSCIRLNNTEGGRSVKQETTGI